MGDGLLPPQFRNHPRLLDSLWKLLMDEIGGPRMIELLYRHHVEGHSLRKLAELEGIPVGTLRGRLDKAKAILDRIDLWPEAWQRTEKPAEDAEKEFLYARPGGYWVPPPRRDAFERWVRALFYAR